jgi:hypothetical protein
MASDEKEVQGDAIETAHHETGNVHYAAERGQFATDK